MRDETGRPLPVEIASRESKYAAAPELLQPGDWVCLNVDTSCPWPVRPQSTDFGGHRIWVIPLTLEEYPGIAVQCSPGLNRDEAAKLLYRFLSVLAWREEHGIAVAHQSGDRRPHMVGLNKKYGFSICEGFDFTELICPEEEDTRIALALMREARSLNHYGYAFLSFWRVLELAFPASKQREAWIERALSRLTGHGVAEALNSITAEGLKDVSRHLFESGRCAVAHASRKPIVNPDDPSDSRRLYRELPLVREMAVLAIEERFGILTPQIEYREHLYELRGWKKILGVDLVQRLVSGEGVRPNEEVDLPEIHVRQREFPHYGVFEGMSPSNAVVQDGKVHLVYRSETGLCFTNFILDFGIERIIFDIEDGIVLNDDGSVVAAEHNADCQRFIRDYGLNGELQIWNASNGGLLSRKDAFIPLNCYFNLDACNAIIAAAQAEVERRRVVSSASDCEAQPG
jgi:hypothetical protein